MSGLTDIDDLLRSMRPRLREGTYVICTVEAGFRPGDAAPVCVFQEDEGQTLILNATDAEQLHLRGGFECAWITLEVHSSLEAVGFLAEIARVLTEARISCNVVAGYYHDHLFVPRADAGRALAALEDLQRARASEGPRD